MMSVGDSKTLSKKLEAFEPGGFKLFFQPLFREDSHFDEYFSDGWFNHQPVTV